jgi:hypothetical protein
MKILQKVLDRLGELAVENAMKINPFKSKAVRFTRARVKGPLNYSLMDTLIPERSSCKYLGIILRSDLSWADHVIYIVNKAWKALRIRMRILKKGNSYSQSFVYVSLVRPILECGTACWDLYREGKNNCVRLAPEESCQICTSYEQSELGNSGVAQKVITYMCPLQSLLWRTVVEGYKRQFTTATLSEHSRP